MSAASQTIRAGRLQLCGLDVALGNGKGANAPFTAVHQFSLDIPAGQFVCILGPSGCGKSTLLGAIAGHLPAAAGEILLDGAPVRGPAPERGLVFQQHSLFPWKRVLDNVAFGLKMQGVSASAREREAQALLDLVGLGSFAQRYPAQLSGGMQQRVEIARVLINRPRVLLMDEPFGALDAQTRAHMQALLLDVWTQMRTTVVFVTHDIDEALFLADRVLVMSPRPGRILDDIAVAFDRPRHGDLLTENAFISLKRHCRALLQQEFRGAPASIGSPHGKLTCNA
ncbi:Nitrate ABC transporter ATP-binding protein (plasmid) [Cupriavidus taiwanensis]|uniref:Nitrate ABC transporter ATP-binding protein n=1 Tax=Cupriavidus taiwanensis TaxID=164546 RepID=A0A375IR67_9BURK|nr:ABC transporter ATP-binding protein [Cupriavidus taiwanensis]SPK70529.1 Nitrate ABC transporter ATP-binding protein [Cupriavidus taiwanensis]SPK77104.1 Nitrate ABC transporter ATP-binding protein [Cupriavidus taiwanensis]